MTSQYQMAGSPSSALRTASLFLPRILPSEGAGYCAAFDGSSRGMLRAAAAAMVRWRDTFSTPALLASSIASTSSGQAALQGAVKAVHLHLAPCLDNLARWEP